MQEIRDGLSQKGVKIPPNLEDILLDVDTDGSGRIGN
jgi:hypothetical protein